MMWVTWFCCAVLVFSQVIIDHPIQATTIEDLQKLKAKLPSLNPRECRWSSSYSELNHEPVLFCHYPLQSSAFGNAIGHYFEGASCADVVGMHFVSVGIIEKRSFFETFPTVIVHPEPNMDAKDVNLSIVNVCNLKHYPWEKSGAWNLRPKQIGERMRFALDSVFPRALNSTVSESYFSNVSVHLQSYPFIPDAAIVFRCGDIIHLTWDVYGFLPFQIYQKLIPKDVRSIYILTEPAGYMEANVKPQWYAKGQLFCSNFLHELQSFLSNSFSSAIIGIIRGHPIENMAVISYAKRSVVCSPTVYCIWPGLVQNHKIFLHSGRLILERTFLTEHFYWIQSPPLVLLGDKFIKDASWQTLLAHLAANITEPVLVRNSVKGDPPHRIVS